MKRLGVLQDEDRVQVDDIARFKATFAAPLSASKQEALQMLLADGFKPVALNLDLDGLEESAR